jgi:hypothetical protein
MQVNEFRNIILSNCAANSLFCTHIHTSRVSKNQILRCFGKKRRALGPEMSIKLKSASPKVNY